MTQVISVTNVVPYFHAWLCTLWATPQECKGQVTLYICSHSIYHNLCSSENNGLAINVVDWHPISQVFWILIYTCGGPLCAWHSTAGWSSFLQLRYQTMLLMLERKNHNFHEGCLQEIVGTGHHIIPYLLCWTQQGQLCKRMSSSRVCPCFWYIISAQIEVITISVSIFIISQIRHLTAEYLYYCKSLHMEQKELFTSLDYFLV